MLRARHLVWMELEVDQFSTRELVASKPIMNAIMKPQLILISQMQTIFITFSSHRCSDFRLYDLVQG